MREKEVDPRKTGFLFLLFSFEQNRTPASGLACLLGWLGELAVDSSRFVRFQMAGCDRQRGNERANEPSGEKSESSKKNFLKRVVRETTES